MLGQRACTIDGLDRECASARELRPMCCLSPGPSISPAFRCVLGILYSKPGLFSQEAPTAGAAGRGWGEDGAAVQVKP